MPTPEQQTRMDEQTKDPSVIQSSVPDYQLTFLNDEGLFASLFRQIRERMHEPKITVPSEYYRGQASLPVTEMKAWYRDLPGLIRSLFEKPQPPSIPITSQPIEVPEIWQDYKQQPASWLNSLLVHAVALVALFLPFLIKRMVTPAKAATKVEVIDVSPYLAQLPHSAKQAGGGGGGGDRTPSPPSKGAIPKFARQQFTPPVAKIPDITPKLPMQPTLLGPPELKLPQMANANFGDPQGVLGPQSNGPGYGGGIGTGTGTGIGSGNGGGLGPGSGGGTGGGPFSVGGGVTAPIPIYKPQPEYSEEARKAKFSGTVVLWITVDAAGNVQPDIRVAKPLGLGLDEKAMETVRTWRFKPGMKNGVPVPVRVAVEVSFQLL